MEKLRQNKLDRFSLAIIFNVSMFFNYKTLLKLYSKFEHLTKPVKVTDNNKYTSLLRYEINYGSKKL